MIQVTTAAGYADPGNVYRESKQRGLYFLMAEKKSTHGGRREGAGRKPKGDDLKKPLGAKVDRETREKVKLLAEQYNVSQAYVVEQAVKRITKIT